MPTRPRRRSPAEHFVYIYRDNRGRCRYVGYGKSPFRAASHLSGSHSALLNSFIKKSNGKFSIEHGGPYGKEDIGRAIETALISVLDPSCNIKPGSTKWRFRPYGVPPHLARRLHREPLRRSELVQLFAKKNLCPALFVYISSEKFTDGRVGYDPAHPPSDKEILERIDHQWQLRSRLDKWSGEPRKSPGILIGVAGTSEARIIIGAVKIDRRKWGSTKIDGSDIWIPTKGPKDLDALRLRGRRISPNANIKFSRAYSGFFYILSRNGRKL